MNQILQIKCTGASLLELERLNEFQGELKSLSKENYEKLRKEITETGFAYPFNVWTDEQGKHWIVDGHQRRRTLLKLREEGWEIPALPVSWVQAESYTAAKRRVLQGTSQYGRIEKQGLYEFMSEAAIKIEDLEYSFALPEISMIDFKLEYFQDPSTNSGGGSGDPGVESVSLADRFLVPPFSVLDARQGYWQDRKRKWIALGIESEKGRGENLLKMSDTVLQPDPEKRLAMKQEANAHLNADQQKSLGFYAAYRNAGVLDRNSGGTTGTSIFDPVLCELAYRWFSPKQGIVLDPFAGGSVRGIVASKLERQYIGIDLRQEQIDQNMEQAKKICDAIQAPRWICGDSKEELEKNKELISADFIFSCPPYADLEVYSDDPRDISNMNYAEFLAAYREIIAKSCALLKDDSFAAFVVGDIRDKSGHYRNFISHTISAFCDAGLELYNEAILVTAVGTLPIRAGRMFSASRKLGKTHQQLLVFLKGDAKLATARCGLVELSDDMFAGLEPLQAEGE